MHVRAQAMPRWPIVLGMIAAVLVATAATSLMLRFALAGYSASADHDIPNNLADDVSASDAIIVGTVVSPEPLGHTDRVFMDGKLQLTPGTQEPRADLPPMPQFSYSGCIIWVDEVFLDDRSYGGGLREGDIVSLLMGGDVSVDPTATPADPLVWYNRSALYGHTPHCEVGDHHLYFLTTEGDSEHYALYYGVHSRLSIDGPEVMLSTKPAVVIDVGEDSETAAFLSELRKLIAPRAKEATEQAEAQARHQREWT